jgi:hypothetical protein
VGAEDFDFGFGWIAQKEKSSLKWKRAGDEPARRKSRRCHAPQGAYQPTDTDMRTVTHPQKFGQAKHPWFYVERLIAGLNAPPTVKYLLSLIHLYTNARRGFAWASQETLARAMCVDLRTVERLFAWAKKRKLVIVRNVRTGPKDQHNEYYLNVEHLEDWQRETDTEDPTPMSGHTTPMTRQKAQEDPTPVSVEVKI